MKTGNTREDPPPYPTPKRPQWSPAMKTGNTTSTRVLTSQSYWPQWSPAMKTGNTGGCPHFRAEGGGASMEPGHEDREYGPDTWYLQVDQ